MWLGAERLQAQQQECAQLAAAGEEARARAARLEADLTGLSGAYNALEAHASALEDRLRDLEPSSEGPAAPGALSRWPAMRRIGCHKGSVPVTVLASGAGQKSGTEAADEEEDDGMDDLLMCLGQVSSGM